jgi:hypothetical protein
MSVEDTPELLTDWPDLYRALRRRVEELDISRESIDHISGLPSGYAAKLLCEPPVRHLGRVSLFPLLGALGLAIQLVENEQYAVKIQQYTPRGHTGPRGLDWRAARYFAVAREFGRQGALKMMANQTPEQLRAQRSKAGKSRQKQLRAERRQARRDAKSLLGR